MGRRSEPWMTSPVWFLTSIHQEVGNFDLGAKLEIAILGALEMAIAEGRARWTKAEAEVQQLKERLSVQEKTT